MAVAEKQVVPAEARALRREAARLERRRRSLRKFTREFGEIDGVTKLLRDAALRLERRIVRMRADADRVVEAANRPRRTVSDLDPHLQAGTKNIALVRGALARLRQASQAEIGRAAAELAEETGVTPVGSGSLTWALRALEADGVVEPTGERVGNSTVFRLVPKRDRVTRMEPGS